MDTFATAEIASPPALASPVYAGRYRPGDRLLWCHDLRHAWTVTGPGEGHRMVRAVIGNCIMVAAEERMIPVPADWQDAPEHPVGSAARSLEYEAWRDKDAHDALDPEYQAALAQWRDEFAAWDREHRQPLLKRLAGAGLPQECRA